MSPRATSTFLEPFQSWWFHHFSGHLVPMPNHPYRQEFSLNSSLNLTWCNLRMFPLILLQVSWEKRPNPPVYKLLSSYFFHERKWMTETGEFSTSLLVFHIEMFSAYPTKLLCHLMCYPGTNCFLGKGRQTQNTLSPDTSPQIMLNTCLCVPSMTTAPVWDVHISRHLTSSWVNVNTLPEEVWDFREFSTDWEIAVGSGVRLSGSYSWSHASIWGQAANNAVPMRVRDGQRNIPAPFKSEPMRVFYNGGNNLGLFWNTGEIQEIFPE